MLVIRAMEWRELKGILAASPDLALVVGRLDNTMCLLMAIQWITKLHYALKGALYYFPKHLSGLGDKKNK